MAYSKLRPFFSRKTTLNNKRQEFQQWESYFPSFLFAKVSTFLVRIVRIIPGLFYLALEAEMVFPTFPVKTWRIFVLLRSKVQKIRRTVLQQTHITENMKILLFIEPLYLKRIFTATPCMISLSSFLSPLFTQPHCFRIILSLVEAITHGIIHFLYSNQLNKTFMISKFERHNSLVSVFFVFLVRKRLKSEKSINFFHILILLFLSCKC